MKLKKLGACIAAFILILNSVSAPVGLAVADDNVATVENPQAPVEASATVPETPTTPEQPTVPETPTTPEQPTVPETPTTPEQPTTPEMPTTPEQPTVPETPTIPEQPTVPETPTTPEQPTTPEMPAEPAESTPTTAPEAPAEPTTAPAEPTTAPAEPTTAPAEPTTAPAEPTTAPAEPTTAPAEPTTAPAEPTTAPVEPTPTTAPEGTPEATSTTTPEGTTEPTETPVPEETVAPTEPDIQLSLHDVAPDKSTCAPGEPVTWHFVCEGAESITYEIRNSQGMVVQSGAPEEGNKIFFRSEECDTYTLTLTATAGEETLTATSTISVVAVEEENLSLKLTVEKTEYAPGEAITWNIECEGAETITYEIRNSQGTVVQSGAPEEGNKISFQTEECDTYTLTVTAAAGEKTVSETSTISVVAVEEETLSLILTVDKTEYAPGEAITWNIACEGADSITYEIRNSQGTVVQSGAPEEGNKISFQTEECDTYTLTVIAMVGEETLTATSIISVAEAFSLTLTVEKTVYAPSEPVIWQFECKGADSLAYEIANSQGAVVRSATIEEGNEISFQTEVCDAYTLTLTATAGEETLSETSTIFVTTGSVAVTLATELRYGVANESPIDFQAEILGGIAPYTVAVQAVVEGAVVCEQTTEAAQPGILPLSIMPTAFGVHTITVTVTDAAGIAAQAVLELPVAIREPESEEDWSASVGGASITGDWRDDLAAVARTQVGYQESLRDFIIDEEGILHGYTRYGAWNGDPYGEWNAAFVSFCLSYANIPSAHFPRSTDCASWKSTLNGMGLYQDDKRSYTPAQGDLIFFNWSGGSTPECVGIVDEVSSDTVYAIMGLAGQGVTRSEYSLGDARITGYASMEAAMRKAGLLKEKVKTGPITLEARWEGETLGVGDTVTLTALDTEGAPVLWQCLMQEGGEWQLAQEGGETFTFEVTQENCVWSWRAVYASDVVSAESAENTEATENTENTANAENAEGDEQ